MAVNEFAELEAEVEQHDTVEGSVRALIEGLVAQIEAAQNDPAALAAMATRLRGSAAALAAAVEANTPAEEEPDSDTA